MFFPAVGVSIGMLLFDRSNIHELLLRNDVSQRFKLNWQLLKKS